MFSCASLPTPPGRLGESVYCGAPVPPVDSGRWRLAICSPAVHTWSEMDWLPNEIGMNDGVGVGVAVKTAVEVAMGVSVCASTPRHWAGATASAMAKAAAPTAATAAERDNQVSTPPCSYRNDNDERCGPTRTPRERARRRLTIADSVNAMQ